MNFDGHELYKINNNWLFDLTTLTCYRVYFKNNKIYKAEVIFTVEESDNFINYKINKNVSSIPIGVMRKALNLVKLRHKGL
ncbi:MAG: hypothetical protein IJ593_11275 [Lachnospiraceae bacterium]|nr:hypothetical protein [Lachnospiraceae bacterium]